MNRKKKDAIQKLKRAQVEPLEIRATVKAFKNTANSLLIR